MGQGTTILGKEFQINKKLFLRLGRFSNLPTVFSQVATITIIAADGIYLFPFLGVCLGFAALYTSGMFLNDGFDCEYDRRLQNFRPIPRGEIDTMEVFFWGIALMVLGLFFFTAGGAAPGISPLASMIIALLTAVTILFYSWHHKNNPYGPLIMGFCRGWVYLGTALAFSHFQLWMIPVFFAAVLYTLMLTQVAKSKWANDSIVGWLVAGICFVDVAILIACAKEAWIPLPIMMFIATRFFHRYIRGT